MRMFAGTGRAAKRFGGDRRGNFGMMMAVTAPMLMLAAGYGVNVAQMVTARSNLLAALDSAVTSTARDLTTGAIDEKDARSVVEAFLFANGTRSFASSDRITLDSIVVDKAKSTVSAQASVVIDVAFPVFGLANEQEITTRSAAVYSDKKIEIAMMLDVTGSMAGRKLRDLQTAATNAVETLLKGQDASKPRVRVAIVPYANSVNVGRSIAETAVFVERKRFDRKQAPGNDEPKAISAGSSRPDYCATERKGDDQYNDNGPASSMVNRDYLIDAYARDYRSRPCPRAEIVPLTADVDDLVETIDDFVAEGGTGGHMGIQWSWYMLSERWKDVVGSEAAAAHNDPKAVAKYAILMTDGEFNLSYFDADDASEVYNDRGKEQTRAAAKQLCREMKEDGIVIFTIGFKLENSYARETMSDCASPDDGPVRHFFDTADGEQLDAAFKEIARNIESLALTR